MPATENLVPGNRVYKEKLVIQDGTEYRTWDPFRSKLSATIMNGLDGLCIHNMDRVLYLGASTGTTLSHVSDIVGNGGAVFGVDHSSRVARDFMDRVAAHRTNVIPVMQDARRPEEYFAVSGRMDVVYADIAQPDQTQIAIKNCKMFLKKGGAFFLVVKVRSISAAKSAKKVVAEEADRLSDFEILDTIDLAPYHKEHAIIISRY
ncbi:MAG: fibrillarin-like rRNA/tRNA 2'-O-methyltransferase [Nitrosopumilus sp. H8]|nr:MAG: fibrillarin-like rRNA/tRNA 2'-O-methyltransferase [Nitrosopumilus sp. H13]RNJ78006.1 MAG: fibrillarin-like rRNA/tRNA 2'-O-methyltransferase [Nitrosopumilus sp. H8]